MMSMRKKTAAAIRSTVWILVGLPALNLVTRFIFNACGLKLPTILSLPNFIFFMVVMGGLSAYLITNAKEE